MKAMYYGMPLHVFFVMLLPETLWAFAPTTVIGTAATISPNRRDSLTLSRAAIVYPNQGDDD
jgi:hypothetical protein